MSSRIYKRLAETSAETASTTEWEYHPDWFAVYNRQYAELVARECIDWINKNCGMVDDCARIELLKHIGVGDGSTN